MLLVVAYVSLLLGAATWLPRNAIAKPSSESLYFSLAAIVAVWAVFSHRRGTLRLIVWLVLMVLVAVVVSYVPPGYLWSAIIGVDWLRPVLVCLHSLVIASYLFLWRSCFGTRPSNSQPSGRGAARWLPLNDRRGILVLFSLAITVPLAVLYYELVKPLTIPNDPLPDPNGYEMLVAAGAAVNEGNATNLPNPTVAQLRAFVEENTKALEMADAAIGVPSRVRLDYKDSDVISDGPSQIRSVGRAMHARGLLADKEGRIDDAVRHFLNAVQVARQGETGGLLVHRLTGAAVEQLGLDGLDSIVTSMSAEQCRLVIIRLTAFESGREPLQDVLARDELWGKSAYGWYGRLLALVGPNHTHPVLDNARIRNSMCNLAVRLYEMEHGHLPAELADLVPEYLERVPTDIFDGLPVKYRIHYGGFTIYCVGPNGRDDGGVQGKDAPLIFRSTVEPQ
jgi:hypothetical protein